MAVTNEFMEAVQSGKELRVRIMLKDSLLVDPTAAQFEEMERYASSQMGSVYVEHDGESLNYDVSAWSEDYLNRQMVEVVSNFSKERIDLLKSMVRYIYRDKANKIRATQNSTYVDHNLSRKQIGAGVTTVGAALTVAGICASQIALTAGGAVVAAAGIALIVSDRGND